MIEWEIKEKSFGPNAKTIWEVMKIHGLSFEEVTNDMEADVDVDKLKKEVELFEKQVNYPYIIDTHNKDIPEIVIEK